MCKQNSDGFLLIEALMALGIVMLFCLIIGSYWQIMGNTYRLAVHQLEAVSIAQEILDGTWHKKVDQQNHTFFVTEITRRSGVTPWELSSAMILETVRVSWKEQGIARSVMVQAVRPG
jgi:hypothetical protein